MHIRRFLLGLVVGVLLSALLVGALLVYSQTRPLVVPQPGEQSGREQLRVSADETLLSALVTEAARDQDPTMEKVVVDLRSGGWLDLILGAKVTVAGQTANLQLKLIGALVVSSGRLEFVVSQLELAGMPISVELLPAAMRGQTDTLVNDANELVAEALVKTGLEVLSANTDDGNLSVSLALVDH